MSRNNSRVKVIADSVRHWKSAGRCASGFCLRRVLAKRHDNCSRVTVPSGKGVPEIHEADDKLLPAEYFHPAEVRNGSIPRLLLSLFLLLFISSSGRSFILNHQDTQLIEQIKRNPSKLPSGHKRSSEGVAQSA